MNQYIALMKGNTLIKNKYFDGFLKINEHSSLTVWDMDSSKEKSIEYGELKEYLTTDNFSEWKMVFCESEYDEIPNILSEADVFNGTCIELKAKFELPLGYGSEVFTNLHANRVFSSSTSLVDYILGDYSYSKSKVARELRTTIESYLPKESFDSVKGFCIGREVADEDSISFNYENGKIKAKMLIGVNSEIFKQAQEKINDSFTLDSSDSFHKDISRKVEDLYKKNVDKYEESLKQEMIKRLKVIKPYINDLLNNDVIIKNKGNLEIVKRMDQSINEGINTSFLSPSLQLDSGYFYGDYEYTQAETENINPKFTTQNLVEIISKKQGIHASSLEIYNKMCTARELLQSNIRGVQVKEIISESSGKKELAAEIDKIADEEIQHINQVKEKWVQKNKQEEELEFNSLRVNSEEYSIGTKTQISRSDNYAEALNMLERVEGLRDSIIDFNFSEKSIGEFKTELNTFRESSKELYEKYSGEGALIMSQKVVNALLSFCEREKNTSENEEVFIKGFIYEGVGNYLNYYDSVINGRDNSKAKATIEGTIIKLKSISPEKLSLAELSQEVKDIFIALTENKVLSDARDYEYKISNINGRGSYYTPDNFRSFLAPFCNDNKFPGPISILDTCAGKGSMLKFLDGANVRKIGNDINPISRKVLELTQGLDLDGLSNAVSVEDVRRILSRQTLITTHGSALSYLDHDIKVDFFLSNPPYIKDIIGNKERETILRSNKVKQISGGRVNMVEANFRGMIGTLKHGGVGMLISSANGISKIDQKLKIDDNNVLVPLYRIGVSGDPFKNEGVSLAPIEISGTEISTFEDQAIIKRGGYAEFFVTLYTRLNSAQAEKFATIAPTILVNYSEISEFNQYVIDNIETDKQLSQYKEFLSTQRICRLKDIDNGFNLFDEKEKAYITSDEYEKIFKNHPNFKEHMKDLRKKDKNLLSVKRTKFSGEVHDQVEEIFKKAKRISPKLGHLLIESIKSELHEKTLFGVLEDTYGLKYNSYNFSVLDSKTVKQIGGKYFINDKDYTALIKYPFPFSLNVLPRESYKALLASYLTSISSSHDLLKEKFYSIEQIIDDLVELSNKRTIKTISSLKSVDKTQIQSLYKTIIDNKSELESSNLEIVNQIIKDNNIQEHEDLILFASSNISYLNSSSKLETLLHRGKKFPKGYAIKLVDDSIEKQTEYTKEILLKFFQKAAAKSDNKALKLASEKKHYSSTQLLKEIADVLITQYDNGEDNLDTILPFKKSNSELLREFSTLANYKENKRISGIERFMREISAIDSNLSRYNDILKKAVGNLGITTSLEDIIDDYIKQEKKSSYSLSDVSNYIYSTKNYYIKRYLPSENEINSIEERVKSIQEIVNDFQNNTLKLEMNKRIEILSKNINSIKGLNEEVINAFSHNWIAEREKKEDIKYNSDYISEVKRAIEVISEYKLEFISFKSLESELKELVPTGSTFFEKSSSGKRLLSGILSDKRAKRLNAIEKFESINSDFFIDKISKEKDKAVFEENMLLDIYKKEYIKEIKNEFSKRSSYISEVLAFYQKVEGEVATKKEESIYSNFLKEAKYLTQNLNEYEKMFTLYYLKENFQNGTSYDQFVLSNMEQATKFSEKTLKAKLDKKYTDLQKYGRDVSDSIIASLGVKSNYSKLYSSILLDIESELIRNEREELIFTKEYRDFRTYLETISPLEEKIKYSKKYAQLLDQESLLRKKSPLLKDILEIDEYSAFLTENKLENIEEEEIVKILMSEKDLKVNARKRIQEEIEIVKNNIATLKGKEEGERMLPTFTQSKALFKFHKSVQEEKNLVKLLNQSEVGTGKTFTMPFYEAVLDRKFKNNTRSIKVYITEANLVSNTRKSLIENGRTPGEILEAKLSKTSDVHEIIKFIKNGGTDVILSSSTLFALDVNALRGFGTFLKKWGANIYLNSDEATFLKNTENSTYLGYKSLLSTLKKTKNLKLQNYLTATPVNNDNGDFLYLIELFNKKNIISLLKKEDLSGKDAKSFYKLLASLNELSLGNKEIFIKESSKGEAQISYFYIPKIVYLLEYIRTGSARSLEGINLNSDIEIPSKLDPEKSEFVSIKEYYSNLGIEILAITKEEYNNPNFRSDEPISLNSKDPKNTQHFINIFRNINAVNFDRNLNSIGLDGMKSEIFKTYYSLEPSLIEALIIDHYLQVMERIGRFKKISFAINEVKRKKIYDLSHRFESEGKNILNNILIESAVSLGIKYEEDSYESVVRVKRGYKEMEESKRFTTYQIDLDDLHTVQQGDGTSLFIFGDKLIDQVFLNIDPISYVKYKQIISDIQELKDNGASEKIINRETKEANKVLDGMCMILGDLRGRVIDSKSTREEIINLLTEDKEEGKIETIKHTFIDTPDAIVLEIEKVKVDSLTGNKKINDLIFQLKKTTGSSMSERSQIIQLLEDFNSPLVGSFIGTALDNLVKDFKSEGIEVSISDGEKEELLNHIIHKGNTLSGTLQDIAKENSKNGINSFITVSYLNTVDNIYNSIEKETGKAYKITGKSAKTSKEKLNIINKYDKLDGLGKTLVATGKSVEKGLSIFNALKGYTTVGDENAGALTQRIGRFRTIMEKQQADLDVFIESSKGDSSKESKLNIKSAEILKKNKKEFFVLSNKLSEAMLQNSESKNILLQKVNCTSLFDGIEEFNDTYVGTGSSSFNREKVYAYVKDMIEKEKSEFIEGAKVLGGNIQGHEFAHLIKKNISSNIKKNIKNIKMVEGLKVELPTEFQKTLPIK